MSRLIDEQLLSDLLSVTKDIARGNYAHDVGSLADKKYPPEVMELIESLGVMAVKFQARELRFENFLYNIVESLAEAIDAKSPWTAGHSKRVTQYAVIIAQRLGKGEDFVKKVRMAGLLHDIGKIGIPEKIINKKSFLTKRERAKMQQHTLIGAKILNHIEGFQDIVSGIKYHHERPDGAGYPEGLKGQTIPLVARILAIADSYDCLTSNRPYQRKLNKYKAYRTLIRLRDKQWDSALIDLFLEGQKDQIKKEEEDMLTEKIDNDMKEAMRAHDEIKLSTLRMLKAAIQNEVIAKRIDKMEDPAVIDCIRRQIKQRKDAVEGFTKGNRPELAKKEEAESKVLEGYLPAQAPEAEVERVVKDVIAGAGVVTRKDMGKIIKLVMEKLKGAAEGRVVSQVVAKYLQ